MHKWRKLPFIVLSLILSVILAFTFLDVNNSSVQAAPALNNGLALTPPMGWNSWNHYFQNINESIIKSAADAVVSSGMKTAGYQYVNIDAGWWTGSRDSGGNITVNQTLWPGGMQAAAAYIHSKGLKAGIYTDAGINGCVGNNQGSYNHYAQDMLQFAKWGFDYVKVDWCGGNSQGLNPTTQYAQIRDAIASATAQTGHTMVFSICNWGVSSPWVWGPSTGNLWRTTGDITCYSSSCNQWNNVMSNLDANAQHASSAGPGAWNDPDMLEVGNGGMNSTEDQAHFALWAIEAAPLFAGNDITTMSSTTRSILTNSEVIAVDQDATGVQGNKVYDSGSGLQVWSKRLQGSGIYAVALLNRSGSAANITANWNTVGLAAGSASVRDLIAHVDRGSFNNSYTANVPSHGVVMLKISGTSGGTTYYKIVNRNSGQALDISGASTANGGVAIQWPYSGSANQQWQEVSVNGGYKLVNRNSSKLLDDPGYTKTTGTQIDQWADGNGNNQWWNLVSAGNGYYYLVNQYSGLYADVSGASTANGASVVLWTSTGGANQQWQVVAA